MPLDSPFSPDAIARSVHATLDGAIAAIPDGHTHAILIDGSYQQADGPAGRVMFVQKAPDGWDVAFSAGYDRPHGIGAQVALMDSW